MAIQYRVNYKKAIETILWLSNKKPGIDIYHIGKVIFYAEKFHLEKYARPLIGDVYIKGPYGPFPSTIRDIIKQDLKWLDSDSLQESIDALRVVNELHPTLIPKRAADLDFFSKTDIECLSDALKKVGNLGFNELKKLSHEEKSFLSAIKNGRMNYELLISKDNPLRDEIIKEIRETSRYVCIE